MPTPTCSRPPAHRGTLRACTTSLSSPTRPASPPLCRYHRCRRPASATAHAKPGPPRRALALLLRRLRQGWQWSIGRWLCPDVGLRPSPALTSLPLPAPPMPLQLPRLRNICRQMHCTSTEPFSLHNSSRFTTLLALLFFVQAQLAYCRLAVIQVCSLCDAYRCPTSTHPLTHSRCPALTSRATGVSWSPAPALALYMPMRVFCAPLPPLAHPLPAHIPAWCVNDCTYPHLHACLHACIWRGTAAVRQRRHPQDASSAAHRGAALLLP